MSEFARQRFDAENLPKWIAEARFCMGATTPEQLSAGTQALERVLEYLDKLEDDYDERVYAALDE